MVRHRGGKYILPTALLFVVFGIIPVLYALYNSAFYWNIFAIGGKRFIGLGNYREILNSGYHLSALGRTLLFVVLSLLVELPLGLGIAVLLDRAFRGKRFVRSILVLPLTIPPISVGTTFLLLLRDSTGIVPAILQSIGLGFDLSNSAIHAWIGIIMMDVWHWTPLVALVFLAGLTSIPESQIESARIDGANRWEIFRYIQLPQLQTVGLVVLLIRIMDLFRTYTDVWTLTGGGPGLSTFLLNMDIVRTVLNASRYGLGSALSIFTLYIIIFLSWWMVNLLHQEVLE